jgi:phosphohistidine phosphatase SixA
VYAEAGKKLRELICEKDASVLFYHSPYIRAKQTLDVIMPFFNEKEVVACLEEPRISEQQIGNFQSVQHVLGECKSNEQHLYVCIVAVRVGSNAAIYPFGRQ